VILGAVTVVIVSDFWGSVPVILLLVDRAVAFALMIALVVVDLIVALVVVDLIVALVVVDLIVALVVVDLIVALDVVIVAAFFLRGVLLVVGLELLAALFFDVVIV